MAGRIKGRNGKMVEISSTENISFQRSVRMNFAKAQFKSSCILYLNATSSDFFNTLRLIKICVFNAKSINSDHFL